MEFIGRWVGDFLRVTWKAGGGGSGGVKSAA